MKKRNLIALAAMGLFTFGCAESPTSTESAALDAPTLNWMNNPDNGNPRIFRYEDHLATSWTDPKTGLRATHTTFPIGNEPDCGPQGLLEPLDRQDVGAEDLNDFLASWFHSNAKGEVWVIVRDVNAAGDCYGNELVGQGTAAFHYTDNDVFSPFSNTRNNVNAWGFTAQGTVTTVGGEELKYTGQMHAVYDPQKDEVISRTAKVHLR